MLATAAITGGLTSMLVSATLLACTPIRLPEDGGPDAGSDASVASDAGSDAATSMDAGHDASVEMDAGACAVDPCTNGGTCMDLAGVATCECLDGFEGDTCEIDIDECAGDPCLNGGACTDQVNGFSCECLDGFEGDTCEVDIDDCAADPCLNGGTCHDGIDSFSCECPSPFTGDVCDALECTPDACRPGYECTTDGSVLACECNEAACISLAGHCGTAGIFYAAFREKDSNLSFGNFGEVLTVWGTGEISELFAGIGSWSSTTSYSVAISGPGGNINYGALTFSANMDQGLDYSQPTVNMGRATLDPPYPVTAGDTLQITFMGTGGHLHAYSDGTHRMTLRGTFTDEACGHSGACGTSTGTYTGGYECSYLE